MGPSFTAQDTTPPTSLVIFIFCDGVKGKLLVRCPTGDSAYSQHLAGCQKLDEFLIQHIRAGRNKRYRSPE